MSIRSALEIKSGLGFSFGVMWRNGRTKIPHDLTGWSARFQIRKTAASAGDPLLSIAVGTGISIDASSGVIKGMVEKDHAQLVALKPGKYEGFLNVLPPNGDEFELVCYDVSVGVAGCR